jgi:hypothetical protein
MDLRLVIARHRRAFALVVGLVASRLRLRAWNHAMTITDAIKKVLSDASKPMTSAEIYQAIVDASLFQFKSTSAASIVRTQLRRHCEGVRINGTSTKTYFRTAGPNLYALSEPSKKNSAS